MRPTFTEEAVYIQATLTPGHAFPRDQSVDNRNTAPFPSHLYPCVVGHGLGALKGAMLTVTTQLAHGGNLLGSSIGGLRTGSFPLILCKGGKHESRGLRI